MIYLSDLMTTDDLTAALGDGLVRSQSHPVLPLTILNYTEKAQYSRTWNNVTRQCRGLIFNHVSGVVVARPFPKFFNWAEEELRAELDLSAASEVTNKMDGSLGIMYPSHLHRTGYAIATRGSFTSEQALLATQLLNDCYPDYSPLDGITRLFEIIYPENRIVVDYGDMSDLVMLGAVDIETGTILGPGWCEDWTGPRTGVFSVYSLRHALQMPPRPNAEGIVVRQGRKMVKIKQDDYVALHRLVTGMNERVVWERLGAGETADDICRNLPEEFWPWVHKVASDLWSAYDAINIEARTEFAQIKLLLPDGWTRKDFALRAQKSGNRALLFLLLDDRDIFEPIWRSIKPSAARSLVATGEDVA